ncbi:Hypothetical protein GLP15_5079 [Giardia lamblia P15]|uniref:Annexin n=1 Tax=Giardia intestinalis (strain P15) TaxID=658858 RepID=E1F7S5_GIAIA|nr:Hypothetical protein GLP15_5079 [Giardia lamblia P15]
MSLVLYCGMSRSCTISNMTNKLSQLKDAIARHDHKTIISLSKSLSRQQAVYMTLKYQAYFGELFFTAHGFSHRSFGHLSIYGSSSVNGIAAIYEGLEHEEGGADDGESIIPSSYYYGELLRGYFTDPYKYDAECLYGSLYHSDGIIAKARDSESSLPNFLEAIELLCTRTDADIMGMRNAYNMLTGGLDMFVDVLSFLSRQSALHQLVSVGLYSLSYRGMYALCTEKLNDPHGKLSSLIAIASIDHLDTSSNQFKAQVSTSVDELLEATKGFAHREATFYEMLFLSSPAHLRAIAAEYKSRTGTELDTVLEEEFTGVISYALRLRYYFVTNPARCYAWIIYRTIKEYRDRSLLRAFLTCLEDIKSVAQEFQHFSKKPLRTELRSISTGNFRRLLLALFDGNYQRLSTIS